MGSGPPSGAGINAAQINLLDRIIVLQQLGVIDKELPSTAEEVLLAILPAFFSDAKMVCLAAQPPCKWKPADQWEIRVTSLKSEEDGE